jgi:hypothetical protein
MEDEEEPYPRLCFGLPQKEQLIRYRFVRKRYLQVLLETYFHYYTVQDDKMQNNNNQLLALVSICYRDKF